MPATERESEGDPAIGDTASARTGRTRTRRTAQISNLHCRRRRMMLARKSAHAIKPPGTWISRVTASNSSTSGGPADDISAPSGEMES